MKKLLTVSVLAIMAVSAANANIASTEYVDKQTGAENGVFAAGSFTNAAAEATNLKDAVNAIAGAVGSENVSAQIGKLDGTINGSGVVTSISQTDGKVTATLKKIGDDEVDSISKEKITGLGTLAEKDTVALGEVEGLTGELDKKQDNISDLQTIREGAALGATSLQDGDVATAITQNGDQAGKLATSGLVAEAISGAIGDFTNETDDIRDIANENKAAIEALDDTYAKDTDVSATYETKTDASAKLEEAKSYADTAEADAVAAAKVETTTQVNVLKNTEVKANTDAIAGMDATYAAQEGKYIASVTQADGKVTATYADLTDVAKMEVPEVCNGTATCALVWNKNTQTLAWEAIMQ